MTKDDDEKKRKERKKEEKRCATSFYLFKVTSGEMSFNWKKEEVYKGKKVIILLYMKREKKPQRREGKGG